MFKVLRNSIALGIAVLCSGCVTTPYWNQEFADHTAAIPIQAWTPNGTAPVKIECSQAFHGGLYPWSTGGNWQHVTDIDPSLSTASYDSKGSAIYSAGIKMVLPSYCWRSENTSAGIRWYSAIRASYLDGSTTRKFYTFDDDGLACLGREMGEDRTISGWLNAGCFKQYSSGTAVNYVIFRARS